MPRTEFYRSSGVALLRAAAAPMTHIPRQWPDPDDTVSCRSWLADAWSQPDLAESIRQASPQLAEKIAAICAGSDLPDRQVRRVAISAVRYLLRATGRPTPFGLFAGVAPVVWASETRTRWGSEHRALARPDAGWLDDVLTTLERSGDLLERLDVVFNSFAVRRGAQLQAPHGQNRVLIPLTKPVRAVQSATACPVNFIRLSSALADSFPAAGPVAVRRLLTDLVEQGFLITSLRAPMTLPDPLGYLLSQLRAADAHTIEPIAALAANLASIHAALDRHNRDTPASGQAKERDQTEDVMRAVSDAGRTRLAVDLRLDCELAIPVGVAEEMERAADALLRLTAHPAGLPEWADYQRAFVERYGTGGLVPLADVVNPDSGIGWPAGYPGSVLHVSHDGPSARDQYLLTLAWTALAEGTGHIELTDETISVLTEGDRLDPRCIPPHVELACQILAETREDLDAGRYTLVVSPARSAGTLTSRFTLVATDSGLERVYRDLPTAVEGAFSIQLSVPPVYPRSQNVGRLPAYLGTVLALGEHRSAEAPGLVDVGDLAVTATRYGLHLVSLSRRRVIEPQVFHALALDKQVPPLARFLATLPRAFCASWTVFDWGKLARHLPHLPELRYGRAVLSPERWRLGADDLPGERATLTEWSAALRQWRNTARCPDRVELHDGSQVLRLDLDEPVHAAIVRAHLGRHGSADLTPAAKSAQYGWIEHHAHEIAVPLVRISQPVPNLVSRSMPTISSGDHGHLPGAPGWLYAKVYTHPELMRDIIADRLPALLDTLGRDTSVWFARYRSEHETDHLRLRIGSGTSSACLANTAAVASWAGLLRRDGLAGRLAFDTYYPEIGRYGSGPAMAAAEAVFAADSAATVVQLGDRTARTFDPVALTALGYLDMVEGFFGSMDDATAWLVQRPITQCIVGRSTANTAVAVARAGVPREQSLWPSVLADAWRERADALATYRATLSSGADIDSVLEAVLHMHHNRTHGIDRAQEQAGRKLARVAATAWRATVHEES